MKRWASILQAIVICGVWCVSLQSSANEPLHDIQPELDLYYDSASETLYIIGWTLDEIDQFTQLLDTDQLDDLMSVYIQLEGYMQADLPSVFGKWIVTDEKLVFEPHYGWSHGATYTAQLNPAMLNNRKTHNHIEITFTISSAIITTDAPTVTTIYPSADELPENLLRFYVVFSQPMQRGTIYENIYLLDADGNRIDRPFLQIGHEFWDRDMQTLTLFLDPGRIKQGVAPNIEAGVPLGASDEFTLVIEDSISDQYGQPLISTIKKQFGIVPADHTSPDPNDWDILPPLTQTHDPLTVKLHGAIDPFLAQQAIQLRSASGDLIATDITLTDNEQTLIMTSHNIWQTGTYELWVYPILEDYAGNRVNTLFDMPPNTVSRLTVQHHNQPIRLIFEIEG